MRGLQNKTVIVTGGGGGVEVVPRLAVMGDHAGEVGAHILPATGRGTRRSLVEGHPEVAHSFTPSSAASAPPCSSTAALPAAAGLAHLITTGVP